MSTNQNRKSSGIRSVPASKIAPTKGDRRKQMARKREERAAKAAHKKQRQAKAYLTDDETLASFSTQLAKMGLELREITGDGNCLFRALGDQLEGHGRNHLKYRRDVVAFMIDHRDDFEPFVEDDVTFDKHVKNLNEIGTYAGNDAIVSFARLNKLHVVIHQLDSPCWQIHGVESSTGKELHISYHNGDHYSSIRKIADTSETPANIKLDNGVLTGTDTGDKKKSKEEDTYPDNSWDGKDYDYDDPVYNGDYGDILEDDNMAKAFRDNEDVVESIKRLTGCEDECLILQTLEDVGMDPDIATELVLKFMQTSLPDESTSKDSSPHETNLWGENGTGNRLFGGYEGGPHSQGCSQERGSLGAKPKLQSGSMRKQNKKQEKKLRAEQRRRQERLGTTAPSGGGSSDDDFTVVAMGTLKI